MKATNGSGTSPPFVKSLVSSDRSIRDRALISLRAYLSRATDLPPEEHLKLWKGLFYSMWLCDKPRNQQNLARDLADLLDVLHNQASILNFIDAFYKTMASQWNGIDSLRMDKYLYLVRCFVNKGFQVCLKAASKSKDLLEKYVEVLEATAANANNVSIPNGLRYQVIDVYVDELVKVDTEHIMSLDILMKPMRNMVKISKNKTLREKASDALKDERVAEWNQTNDSKEQKEGKVKDEGDEDIEDISSDGNEDEGFDGFGE